MTLHFVQSSFNNKVVTIYTLTKNNYGLLTSYHISLFLGGSLQIQLGSVKNTEELPAAPSPPPKKKGGNTLFRK